MPLIWSCKPLGPPSQPPPGGPRWSSPHGDPEGMGEADSLGSAEGEPLGCGDADSLGPGLGVTNWPTTVCAKPTSSGVGDARAIFVTFPLPQSTAFAVLKRHVNPLCENGDAPGAGAEVFCTTISPMPPLIPGVNVAVKVW